MHFPSYFLYYILVGLGPRYGEGYTLGYLKRQSFMKQEHRNSLRARKTYKKRRAMDPPLTAEENMCSIKAVCYKKFEVRGLGCATHLSFQPL